MEQRGEWGGCMTGTPLLAEALVAIPPPPCEVMTCAWRKHCEISRTACESFVAYARSGRWTKGMARKPTRALFSLAFPRT